MLQILIVLFVDVLFANAICLAFALACVRFVAILSAIVVVQVFVAMQDILRELT